MKSDQEIDGKLRDILKEWVNLTTSDSDELTALHYASFNGDRDCIDLLLQCGADPRCLSKQKLSVMHVAAQNNQAYSLTFFRSILADDCLAEVDSGGMTPLHWACDNGSDIAILYLLSWISKSKQHSVINA